MINILDINHSLSVPLAKSDRVHFPIFFIFSIREIFKADLPLHFVIGLAAALPDGGFLRQIKKILADLKVVWQAINISGGFPFSGGCLVDLTNSARPHLFWGFWRNSGVFRVASALLQARHLLQHPTAASTVN
jgi:hypothetical protein